MHAEGFAYFNDAFKPAPELLPGTSRFMDHFRDSLRNTATHGVWIVPETATRFATLLILMQIFRCPWVSRLSAVHVLALASGWPWSSFLLITSSISSEGFWPGVRSASAVALELYEGTVDVRRAWLSEFPLWTEPHRRLLFCTRQKYLILF